MTLDIKEALLEYITVELLDNEVEVAVDDSLLEDGLVDSVGLMRLVAHIETTLGRRIPLEDIVIDNFHSVVAMVEYLNHGRQAG